MGTERKTFTRFKYAEEHAHEIDRAGFPWVMYRDTDKLIEEPDDPSETYEVPQYVVEWVEDEMGEESDFAADWQDREHGDTNHWTTWPQINRERPHGCFPGFVVGDGSLGDEDPLGDQVDGDDLAGLFGEILSVADVQPKMIRWYDSDTDEIEAYIVLSQVVIVNVIPPTGEEPRVLAVKLSNGQLATTSHADTIERFLAEWDVV